jgi:hypothetical protein
MTVRESIPLVEEAETEEARVTREHWCTRSSEMKPRAACLKSSSKLTLGGGEGGLVVGGQPTGLETRNKLSKARTDCQTLFQYKIVDNNVETL